MHELLRKGGYKMSMWLEIEAEPGHLNVIASGEFSLKEAKQTFLQMLEARALHKKDKVLFDGRGLIGNPEFMERFYYGEFAACASLLEGLRGIRFAYVLLEPVRDPKKFGEHVAFNRGMNVKVFETPDDARHWLERGEVDPSCQRARG